MLNTFRPIATLTVLAISLGIFGCSNGSSSLPGSPPNTNGPQIASAEFVDVDGNGVESGDVVIVEFTSAVQLRSSSPTAFTFSSTLDDLGVGAVVRQSVPNSTRVEISLGSAASLVAGTTAINIVTATSGAITNTSGDPVRAVGTDVTVTDITTMPPTMVASTYADADQDGTVNAGDTILVEYDKPVVVPAAASVANNFTTPVTSDSFGTAPTIDAFTEFATNRGVLITLGATPTLTVTGTFAAATVTAGSPSGIETVVAGTAADEVNDTLTASANRPTAGGQVDLTPVSSRTVNSLVEGTLFLGVPDSATPNVGANTLLEPGGSFHYDGNVTIGANTFAVDLFFIADTGNNRVLVYETKPTSNNTDALLVLGQANFASNLPNRSTSTLPSPTANTLWSPEDVHFNASMNQLIVSDTGNNRVLIWDDVLDGATGQVNLMNGVAADVVIGQSGFTARLENQGAAVPTSRTLSGPTGVHTAGGQLAIADTGNNRVLIFGSVPMSNGEAATTVLGQPNFVSATVNNGGISAATLNGPEDVFVDPTLTISNVDGAVLIADTGNNRVLLWQTASPATGSTANVIFGQSNATNNAEDEGGISAARLDGPSGVFASDTGNTAGRIWVCDRDNHRMVLFTFVSPGGAPSTGATGTVLGQANGTDEGENRSSATATPSADSFAFPARVSVSGSSESNLFVADRQNHRILDFSTIPTADTTANVVQGQSAFTVSRANGQLLNEPTGFSFNAGSFFVADALNNRVLIFNTTPTAGTDLPNVITGQANANQTLANQGLTAPTAATMSNPHSVTTDGTRMFVSDTDNHRVLIYNTIPTTDGDTADIVLGQAALTAGLANRGAAVASNSLQSPAEIALNGTDLIVCDRANHRVLIFDDVTSLVTGQAADVVIGQDDFTSNQPNQGQTFAAADSLDDPVGVAVIGGVLYIVDQGNSRVLVYSTVPTTNGESATSVIGQSTLSGKEAGSGFSRLNAPSAVASDGTRFLVADTGNNRVLFYTSIPSFTALATTAVGQGSGSTAANRGAVVPSSVSLASPEDVFFDGRDLWIVDSENSRIVRYR